MASNLRPINTNKAAKKPGRPGRPRKLANVVNSGTEQEFLRVLRRQLAARMDEGTISMHALPAAVKQLREIDKQIRALEQRAAEEAAYDDDGDGSGWDDTSAV